MLARTDAHAAGIGALSDSLPETRVQRSRGRDTADGDGLREWFADTAGQAGQVGPASGRHFARPAVAAGQRQADAAVGLR
ncbi:hypothetical protein GCM10010358_69120 [Streptomyces minutiscleroticus]|uniref:Uncharacterized protein n=1 Tax=Streptomyces minutiscleroticus TaxID=68238 RepID=A0A918NYV7_9ACTN|nr:hypothetical protein [Streptomyces minutiscleroticus]GGY05909.1 hypothetical protein GCM10010358_69120 [Streptomyces minutiscleroticus]